MPFRCKTVRERRGGRFLQKSGKMEKKKSGKGNKRSAPASEEDFLWECSICTYKNNPEAFKGCRIITCLLYSWGHNLLTRILLCSVDNHTLHLFYCNMFIRNSKYILTAPTVG